MVLEDSTAENPLYLFVVIILQTLYEYTACLDILGNGISTLLENSLWCTMCTFTMQQQQYLLPVSYGNHYLHACMDILGNGIISHFGTIQCTFTNGNNICCLCFAFTVIFIYKHQLPMILEDSTAENPLYLFVVIILQTL